MKIKIITDKYEDVTQGKVYEVVEEWIMNYVIIDDQFDENAIDKEHCKIVTEETMFKKGDRVQIVVNSFGKSSLIEEWALQGSEGLCGKIIDLPEPESEGYSVQLDNGCTWYVPEELLQKLTNPNDLEDEVEGVVPMINIGDCVKVIVNQSDLDLDGCDDTVKPGHKYIVQDVDGKAIQLVKDAASWVGMEDVVLVKEDTTPTLTEIIRFTQNNKGFSVSFEDGNITLADWSKDPNATFYRPKTLEELLELMECVHKINEFRDETN